MEVIRTTGMERRERPNDRKRMERVRGSVRYKEGNLSAENVHRVCVSDWLIVIVLHFMVPVDFRSFVRSTE